jgi:predicted dinucleotide-binding enzyme
MKIGIIGSGNVGGALGVRFAQKGHQVVFGSRDPASGDTQKLVAAAGPTASAATLPNAAQSSDILLLATPWAAAKEVIGTLGNLKGKILIDAMNPVLPDMSALAIGTTTSAGEQVAQWAAGAKVVKAFNSVGFNVMENPSFGENRPVMFYCGDDNGAKEKVGSLVDQLGFDGIDAGPLTQARLLEPFALLWVSLAYQAGFGREIAFQFMRREAARGAAR